MTDIICDKTIALDGFYTRQDYPEHPVRSIAAARIPACLAKGDTADGGE